MMSGPGTTDSIAIACWQNPGSTGSALCEVGARDSRHQDAGNAGHRCSAAPVDVEAAGTGDQVRHFGAVAHLQSVGQGAVASGGVGEQQTLDGLVVQHFINSRVGDVGADDGGVRHTREGTTAVQLVGGYFYG